MMKNLYVKGNSKSKKMEALPVSFSTCPAPTMKATNGLPPQEQLPGLCASGWEHSPFVHSNTTFVRIQSLQGTGDWLVTAAGPTN